MLDDDDYRRPGAPELKRIGALVRALRRRLGLTQAKVASRGELDRVQVVKIETDVNRASSHATRLALARGLGVPVDRLDSYLDGEVTLDELLALLAA